MTCSPGFSIREQVCEKFALDASEFPPEDIGMLTGKIEPILWLQKVQSRYRFLNNPTREEKKWANCNPRGAYDVRRVVARYR